MIYVGINELDNVCPSIHSFTPSFSSQLARQRSRFAPAALVRNPRRVRTITSTAYTTWERRKSGRTPALWFPTPRNLRNRTLVGWWNSVHLIHASPILLTQYTTCRTKVALHAPILFSNLYLVDPVIVASFLYRHRIEQDPLSPGALARNTLWESR